jgi:hypothetical protein
VSDFKRNRNSPASYWTKLHSAAFIRMDLCPFDCHYSTIGTKRAGYSSSSSCRSATGSRGGPTKPGSGSSLNAGTGGPRRRESLRGLSARPFRPYHQLVTRLPKVERKRLRRRPSGLETAPSDGSGGGGWLLTAGAVIGAVLLACAVAWVLWPERLRRLLGRLLMAFWRWRQ